MRVLIIGKPHHSEAVRRAAMHEGIELCCISSADARKKPHGEKYDFILVGSDHGAKEPLSGCALIDGKTPTAALDAMNIAAGVGNVPKKEASDITACFAYGGRQNFENAFRIIKSLLGEETWETSAPKSVPLDSIFTEEGKFYSSALEFFEGEGRKYPVYVGILFHRSKWINDDYSPELAISKALNRRNIGTILAFTNNSPDKEIDSLGFDETVRRAFTDCGKPVIELLVNFQFFGSRAQKGQDMFSSASDFFASLNIPVVHPTGLARKSFSEWMEDMRPYSAEMANNFCIPEYQGMIEPIHVYCKGDSGRAAVYERVERLAARIARWVSLRTKKNSEKRIAIMLNNAPCSGVEATIGCASDLDAFESTVAILRRMKAEGYFVENIPENGVALKDMFFEKKAFSDFRWTSVDDIAASGGVLYAMDMSEYNSYYDILSASARSLMEKHWGTPPGEGMVLDNKLIITGIRFGNITVMVQPKRGCYGAKCTGEVCKILHDPACPPPHQYLAAYWYLSKNMRADAVIHLGTHGSLECLPGKSCGLGRDCFPDIAIDELVNLYPYNPSAAAQGVGAGRRGYGVTITHLPAPGRGLDPDRRKLAADIRAYFDAADKNSDQMYPYRIAIEDAAEKMPDARAVFDRTEDFDDACRDLRAMLLKADDRRKGNDAHIFGQKPDRQWISDYITEMWTSDPATAVLFNDIEDPSERAEVITNIINMALSGDRPADAELEYLFEDVKNTACGLLTAGCEMDSLMNALSGGFIRPTPGGDAACGGRAILPPGRNMHEGERGKSPTKAAYERGKKAAAELLRLHMDEGGALPEKIAINMTSLDIVRTGGEQLGQFFALIGMRPVWSPDGRVDGLEVVSLSELCRPRVDVTVHISSIVRDAWPEVLDLMDKAIETVSELDEPEDMNFVKRNSRIISENGEIATGRIFGKEPGTYTSSVKLALKASAWESDEDLARYFIDSSSYLFGGDKQGVHAPGTFAANVRQVDATCDITSSRRYDAVASSYSARVQGGFALAAKVLGSKRNIRQYMGESSQSADISVVTMEKHVSDAISDTLLNDVWREQMMQGGYSSASEFMCRIQNVFEIQCSCNDIADATLDNVVERYVLDERMRKWFADNNPYAIEEAGRRFLELESRGKWNADPEILHKLKLEYLKAEGNLEDVLTGDGEVQAGSVDIINHEKVSSWRERIDKTGELIKKWTK